MPAKRTWPATPSERRDRDRVVDLVTRVGESRFTFTVYDLRREMGRVDRLQLEHSGQLSRHVHALDEGLVTPMGQRLGFGEAQADGRPSKARHRWALTRRLREYEASTPELDDLERVYHALWVAIVALEVTEVPTRTVTNVLRNVEELALRTPRNTLNHLMTLHRRNQRLVDKENREGTRWSMWRPIGSEPDHPHFERWVAAYRALGTGGDHVPGSGHATLNAMAHELVVLALRAKRSSHWPAGHSVQIADIRAVAGVDPRARQLARRIRERGRSLGAVLGDLTKERIAGRTRVERPVIKIASPMSGGSYYDAPDEPGFERRRVVVTYRALRRELSDTHLDQLAVEYAVADQLHRSARSDALRAVGAVRRVMVHRQMEPAERLMLELEDSSALLAKQTRESVREYRGKLNRLHARHGSPDDAQEEAEVLLCRVGLSLDELLSADRPLLTPEEYASYLPAHARRGRSPAEFIANATSLRRFPNTKFVSQTDEDPERAARYVVDRADALCYLAERYQGRTFPFLREGARVLGRDLRHPGLARVLLESLHSRERRAGLAALVLLGDPCAVQTAEQWLGTDAAPQEMADALHALLVLKHVEPSTWPAHVRAGQERAIRDTRTQVVLAARTNRWLLQR